MRLTSHHSSGYGQEWNVEISKVSGVGCVWDIEVCMCDDLNLI